jgi:hypothetical protein
MYFTMEFCKLGAEPSGFHKMKEFLDKMNNCQVLRQIMKLVSLVT